MPLKRHAAAVIGGFLHAVLIEGRTLSALEREAGLTRQTGGCWLKQFGLVYVALVSECLPQLLGAGETPAAVPASAPVPVRHSGMDTVRERLMRAWCLILALAARGLQGMPVAELPVHVLAWLQPELSCLRPAAGVFRVPLYERARGPPGS